MIINSVRKIFAGRPVPAVRPDTTVREACRIIDALNVGTMLVLDGDCLAGILSERYVIRICICRGRRTDETLVAEAMTRDPKTVGPECCLADALALMRSDIFRYLPVLENGRTLGLLPIRDMPTEYRLMLQRFRQDRSTPPAPDPAAPPSARRREGLRRPPRKLSQRDAIRRAGGKAVDGPFAIP